MDHQFTHLSREEERHRNPRCRQQAQVEGSKLRASVREVSTERFPTRLDSRGCIGDEFRHSAIERPEEETRPTRALLLNRELHHAEKEMPAVGRKR